MRFGCLLSTFLCTLSFGILGFFMLPLLFEGNETVNAMHTTLLCDTGETFETRFRTESDLRGTVRGGHVYCVAEDGDGEPTLVTEKSILYAMAGFTVPFLVGLVIGISALQKSAAKASDSIVRSSFTVGVGSGKTHSYTLDPNSVDVATLLRQFGIDNAEVKHVVSRSNKTLTEQLQDLQTAYDKRLISKEEFDRLRQEVLDNVSRSS